MTLHLERNGRWEDIQAVQGDSLYAALTRAGVPLDAPCGGRCFCGKCRVRIEEAGEPLPGERDFLTEAQIGEGYRLACAVPALEGMRVWLAQEAAAQIQTEGGIAAAGCDPAVTVREAKLSAATIEDPRDDFSRLEQSIGPLSAPSCAVLGELKRPFMALYDGGTLLAGRDDCAAYGIAVDIGTTTVVGYLMDLSTGEQLGAASELNAQRAYGADVISRCDAAATDGGLHALSSAIRGQIAGIAARLCEESGISTQDIYHIALVGNTVMMHLLLGAPVGGIAVSPFAPTVARGFDLPADSLSLGCPRAVATLMPCIAGYVGADTVGAALACALDADGPPRLLVDIGTNGEMALASDGQLLCCSTAAGPAFEGAHIACGMGGVRGAVAKVWPADGLLGIETIGGAAPQGICGSGLVDAVAALLGLGAVEDTGRFDEEKLGALSFPVDDKPAVRIAGGVYLTQKDLREVQLAKAAIAAGIEILLKEAGLRAEDIAETYLAGGFGSHIDPDSACRIGLLPRALRANLRAAGNAAGAGARMAVLNKSIRARAATLRERMRYIELSLRADFQDLYVDNMMFPEA